MTRLNNVSAMTRLNNVTAMTRLDNVTAVTPHRLLLVLRVNAIHLIIIIESRITINASKKKVSNYKKCKNKAK